MKNKTKNQLLWFVVVALVAALIYLVRNPKVVKVPVQVGVPMQPRPKPTRAPEFREAPIKKYKPGYMQQMGILTGAGQETLPLYGKEVRGRRDRYHYYTTTGGENLYPIPVAFNGRDCMEDIGCEELYGTETVSVTGKTGSYAVKLYRTDNFF
jgi:hypothetical protein